MNNQISSTVSAIQASVLNVFELLGEVTVGNELEELKGEMHKTMLAMIAAIILSDGKYDVDEEAFLKLLVQWEEPQTSAAFLRDYEAIWKSISFKAPKFFQAAVEHDGRCQTAIAQAILREVQLIGNNACVSNGQFASCEHKLINEYLTFLEEFNRAWHAKPSISDTQKVEGWTSV